MNSGATGKKRAIEQKVGLIFMFKLERMLLVEI